MAAIPPRAARAAGLAQQPTPTALPAAAPAEQVAQQPRLLALQRPSQLAQRPRVTQLPQPPTAEEPAQVEPAGLGALLKLLADLLALLRGHAPEPLTGRLLILLGWDLGGELLVVVQGLLVRDPVGRRPLS